VACAANSVRPAVAASNPPIGRADKSAWLKPNLFQPLDANRPVRLQPLADHGEPDSLFTNIDTRREPARDGQKPIRAMLFAYPCSSSLSRPRAELFGRWQ
jgi:hypothetical protein